MKLQCLLILILLSSTFNFNLTAQQIISGKNNIAESKLSSQSNIEKPGYEEVLISAEIVDQNNDEVTVKIVNPNHKSILYHNDNERDVLTSLPGLISLSILLDETAFTVVIKKYYLKEYLLKKFDVCNENIINETSIKIDE